MSISLVGLNHRSAPLDLRSKVSLAGEELRNFLRIAKDSGLQECVVLSTCNRTELYYVGGSQASIKHALSAISAIPVSDLEQHLYAKSGTCAACHLFRVASGLDSAVLGETEIVAQLKDAWRIASEEKMTGPVLELMLQRSLETSKRVRSETDLCRAATSLASLAVREFLNYTAAKQGARSAVVVGAGQVGSRIAKELAAHEDVLLTLVNRSLENAEALAESVGGKVRALNDLTQTLTEVDCAFMAAQVTQPLISAEELEWVARARNGKPLLILDLGVPANVARAAFDCITIVQVDDLTEVSSSNAERQNHAVPLALGIVEEELERLSGSFHERIAAATIKLLVQHTEEVRRRNLGWALQNLEGLSDKERKVVEELTVRLVKGILGTPIQELKRNPVAQQHRELIEQVFCGSGEDE